MAGSDYPPSFLRDHLVLIPSCPLIEWFRSLCQGQHEDGVNESSASLLVSCRRSNTEISPQRRDMTGENRTGAGHDSRFLESKSMQSKNKRNKRLVKEESRHEIMRGISC